MNDQKNLKVYLQVTPEMEKKLSDRAHIMGVPRASIIKIILDKELNAR